MMTFLIADDAGVMRKVISRYLMEMGAIETQIFQAENGREAVTMASKEAYSLIFMDWNMPVLLGIDAVSEIRAGGIKTPILMVTTEGEKANVIRAIQAGASNYLTKPFTKEDFEAKVTQLVGPITAPIEDAKLRVDLAEGKIRPV
ncbi:MAG: response regulator [Cyanobacteria bacterium]|nr:response regulator [Cyanobacteriota bacterium]